MHYSPQRVSVWFMNYPETQRYWQGTILNAHQSDGYLYWNATFKAYLPDDIQKLVNFQKGQRILLLSVPPGQRPDVFDLDRPMAVLSVCKGVNKCIPALAANPQNHEHALFAEMTVSFDLLWWDGMEDPKKWYAGTLEESLDKVEAK